MKVLFNTVQGTTEYDAEVMTKEEYNKIKGDKDTPSFVYISNNEAYYNDYTCYNSYKYGGICNCINHRTKVWIKFNPTTGKW